MTHRTVALRARQLGGSLLLLTLLLSGCGGGGSDVMPAEAAAPTAAASVPDSAFASTQAFMAFQRTLTPDDRAEPLQIGSLVPPTDDRAEPVQFEA